MLRGSAKSTAGIDGSVLRLITKFDRRRISLPAE
jgi:hypothetical protein